MKGKDKVPLNKITLITLEEKEITHIAEMEKVPHLQNLYLGQNHIYRIENIDCLHKLKILKLERNEICKIEGLHQLESL